MSGAIRLIFAHSDGEVVLLSRQRVDMTLPASPPIHEESAHPEFLAEVRDSDGRALHRTAMPNPLETHREVFSDDPERSIHRVPVEQPQGAFTVVVPDHPDGDHVALLAAHPTAAEQGLLSAGPREVARVSLRETGEAEGGAS